MALISIDRPKEFILDNEVRGCKFLGDYRVTCKIYGSGCVAIEKIERFHEKFQITTNITVEALAQADELEDLRAEIADWYIDEQLEQLRGLKEFENDDLNPPPRAA